MWIAFLQLIGFMTILGFAGLGFLKLLARLIIKEEQDV